ncbi:MAG: hypothetical protein ACLR67_00235 [Eggerthella lenta]
MVLDEAQYIKNHATKTTRAVKLRRPALRAHGHAGGEPPRSVSIDFMPFSAATSGSASATSWALSARMKRRRLACARHRAVLLCCRKADVLTDLPAKLESIRYVPLAASSVAHDGAEQRLWEDRTPRSGRTPAGQSPRAHSRCEKSAVEVLVELTRR